MMKGTSVMINQDLKNKIKDTIGRYEVKCDHLELQINALKNVINQLILSPMGTNSEVDGHLEQFQKQLDEEIDPDTLDKKVTFLVTLLAKLQKKKKANNDAISNLIKQSAESIGRLATKSKDKKAISKLQQMLDDKLESHSILINFNEVLTQCVSSVMKEREELDQIKNTNYKAGEVNTKVNESLQQLLEHLAIPKDLDAKKEKIKANLSQKMHDDDLSKIIDGLTDLVVDAFNVEQTRFKGFLQQVTTQLQDVDVYLKLASNNSKLANENTNQLEHGIQDNINQIKTHLDSSSSIEELTSQVKQNLDGIGERLKQFKEKEALREKELESKIVDLKTKLADSEQSADEIKSILSSQKYKINHDTLTGLPNRASYEEHISEAFQRWKRSGKTLALAVCDIDHFKKINDTFGHLAGDKVLKKVADLLNSSIRNIDFIARIGGEEFVIVFEQTSSKVAAGILEKLRQLIEECQFYYRENKVSVTVSFGLSEVSEGDDIESLFIRADNAMYKAKNAGRNRSEVL